MAFIFKHLAFLAHSCNRGDYRCIGWEPAFVKAVTGAARRSDDDGAVVQRALRKDKFNDSQGEPSC
jgi:hypothetical protein